MILELVTPQLKYFIFLKEPLPFFIVFYKFC